MLRSLRDLRNMYLAQTQTHHSIEGRDLVRESTFTSWKKNPNAGNEKSAPHIYTIWEKAEYRKDGSPNHLMGNGHRFKRLYRLWFLYCKLFN